MKKVSEIKDQIQGVIPNRFSASVIANGHKSVAVRIDLGGYEHRQAIANRMKDAKLTGVSLDRGVLVIAGTHSNIVERVRVCKEQVLLHQAS